MGRRCIGLYQCKLEMKPYYYWKYLPWTHMLVFLLNNSLSWLSSSAFPLFSIPEEPILRTSQIRAENWFWKTNKQSWVIIQRDCIQTVLHWALCPEKSTWTEQKHIVPLDFVTLLLEIINSVLPWQNDSFSHAWLLYYFHWEQRELAGYAENHIERGWSNKSPK